MKKTWKTVRTKSLFSFFVSGLRRNQMLAAVHLVIKENMNSVNTLIMTLTSTIKET